MADSIRFRGLEKLQTHLKAYEKNLPNKLERFINELCEQGVEIMKQNITTYGAIQFGDLFDHCDYAVYQKGKRAVIFNDSDHCAFVEFGTGVVGGYNPHPNLPVPWAYGSGATIDEETGTWYFVNKSTGVSGYTQGMPARPYMWNTSKELRNKLTQIAKEVFAKND